VLVVLFELFFFILIIMYVFLGIGLELFAIADGGNDNYFAHYECELVSELVTRTATLVFNIYFLILSVFSSSQVLCVLLMLMLFVLVICYVFLIIGLELFAVSSNESLARNYFQHYSCELVRRPPCVVSFTVQCQLPLLSRVTACSSQLFCVVC